MMRSINQSGQPTTALQPRICLLVGRLGIVRLPLATFILPITPNVQSLCDIALLLEELRSKSRCNMPRLELRVSTRDSY
jgi:hypothetical protein